MWDNPSPSGEGQGEGSQAVLYDRLTDVIYPNGRDVQYGYGPTGAVDDIMSRLATIGDSSNTYSAYTYLGASQIVQEDYVEAQTKLTYLDSSGDVTGVDRFGRVVDQLWASYGQNPATLDEYTYTYDRAGNRTSRTNALDSALSETYGYNNADELTSWSVNGVQQRTWTLDSLGNDLASGTYSAANEETPTQGSSGYDLAGNMTTLQTGDTAIYDAWNRLVEVTNSSGIVEKYAYDGTNRRIEVQSNFTGTTPGTVEDDYYNEQQVIQTNITAGGIAAGGYQYVWSQRYIDAPILRDTLTTDGTGIIQAERAFYLGDANYNVTALVKYDSTAGAWTVAERYSYDPYVLVHRELEFLPIDVSELGRASCPGSRGIVPRRFIALMPKPERVEGERGRARPGPRSGLGPWDGARVAPLRCPILRPVQFCL
jgi:YD repeat-containing protein